MKNKTLQDILLAITLLAITTYCFGQGVPADQWTQSERQFVDNARSLYQQQGISYTNEQASFAVQQMRQRQPATTRGIPEAEWSPQERTYVEAAKRQYVANGMSFSTEQAQMSVQSMREQIARLTGGVGALQALSSGSVSASVDAQRQPSTQAAGGNLSEDQLARQIASWPRLQEPLSIRSRRDGFDMNGRPVLDSEGGMFNYAYDVTTGAITYAVKTSRGITIKTIGTTPNAQPLVIASGAMGSAGWEIQTVTGKQLAGNTLSILSNGFLVGRSASAFRYQSGQGVQSIAVPNGYVITSLQRGNVGATGFVLLEKDETTGGNNDIEKMLSPFKAIGSIIGVNKKEDYALMDVASGKLYSLNVPADGKQVSLMSQCRRVNWMISECQRAQTFEAVYGTDGMKNNSHYYWLVNWVGTPTGPVAFSLEDGLAHLYITDLATGKKVLAFDRTFGIGDWNIEQGGDGKVAVKAKLAFDWKEIPDAVSFMQSSQ